MNDDNLQTISKLWTTLVDSFYSKHKPYPMVFYRSCNWLNWRMSDMRIALCGSTRFEPEFHNWNHKLAVAGHTVYSLSLFGREVTDIGKEGNKTITEQEKITLDLVHLDKIMNSDAIVVVDVDEYIGFSTKREIQWARMQHKKVFWITEHSKNMNHSLVQNDAWAGCLL